MEREGGTVSNILASACILIMSLSAIGCSYSGLDSVEKSETSVMICLDNNAVITKSEDYMITDISLIIFNDDGLAERNILLNRDCLGTEVNLILGRTYSFYVCMNFGYHVFADHISEMEELTFHLNAPEDIITEKPACGCLKNVTITGDQEIRIIMERLWSAIDVIIDKDALDADVHIDVTGMRICNSPKSVYVFNPQKSTPDRFAEGNTIHEDMTLYMLEDMSGLAYLEIDMDYLSYTHYTHDGPLKYRTYICEAMGEQTILRNSRQKIRIMPEGDGLSGNAWKVDKTWLREFGPSRFVSFPDSYIQGCVGDTLHLWCEFYPPHAQFDIGLEELEEDKMNGIYDYIIDDDGHGVRLILKSPGTGIVYMEAGTPVNEAAMWVVEVSP